LSLHLDLNDWANQETAASAAASVALAVKIRIKIEINDSMIR